MTPDPHENACDACKRLCGDTGQAEQNAHGHLHLDWRKGTYAIYHCNACNRCLIENKLDPMRIWRWAPVQNFFVPEGSEAHG